jgi:hypothetical protein
MLGLIQINRIVHPTNYILKQLSVELILPDQELSKGNRADMTIEYLTAYQTIAKIQPKI